MPRLSHPIARVVAAVLLTGCSDTLVPAPVEFLDPIHEVVVERDIVYGTGEVRPAPDPKDLHLDVYRPRVLETPPGRPGIVLIHGGSFTTGSKSSAPIPDFGWRFAERGYVAVAINYRLVGDDPPTEDLATDPSDPVKVAAAAGRVDAALAVQWLRDHTANYDVDPNRIAIVGYSAGAVTALGVTYWQPGVQHADVDAVVSLSGGLHGSEGVIDAGEPPVLLIHGVLDTAKPLHEAIASRAAEVGVTYEMYEVPGVDHAGMRTALDAAVGSSTVWGAVVDFLYDHLDL